MSACDSCYRPGACGVGLSLNVPRWDSLTRLELLCDMAASFGYAAPDTGLPEMPVPFLPMWKSWQGRWRFFCPNLTREGRCADYENRPYPCRSYQQGEDPLCVMHGMIANPREQQHGI